MLSNVRSRPGEQSVRLLKGGDLVVAGYASVEVVDKQGDKITKEALKDAFKKYMEGDKYRNVQLAHSNIQVGEVIPSYTDTEGRLWKSEVDDVGMFVVVELRDDIEKAKEVAAEIRKGALRGFSIGGQAFKRVRKSDKEHGDYQEISKLELHEVTICEKGINPEATFKILKEDNEKNKVNKMTDEDNDIMTQMGDVLSRLETRLDAFEKGDKPAFLEGKDDDDKKDKKDKSTEVVEQTDNSVEKGEEYSDVITSEYLNWMEDTLKSAGVDTTAARAHFDDVEKANLGASPEELADTEAAKGGQVKGRAQENGKPSTNAISRTTGSGSSTKKGEFLHPSEVTHSDIEAAYEVYKAAALEQEFRKALENEFTSRYSTERVEEISKAEAAAVDARSPLDDINKSIAALGERIDSLANPTEPEVGEELQKSEAAVEIPSTVDLAAMTWDEVHQLADKAFRVD